MVVFLVIDTKKERRRLISVAGLFVFNLIGYLISRYPHRVNCPFILVHMVKFHLIVIRKIILCFQIRWRHVFWGLGLQLIFALLVLRWNVGREVFQCLGDKVQAFLDYTDQGSEFVFGYLVSGVLNPWVNVTIEYNNVTFLNESTVNLPLQEQLFGFKVNRLSNIVMCRLNVVI